MWLTDENGKKIADVNGKAWWIDNFLKQNIDFVSKKVKTALAHRRADLFVIIDGPVGCLTGDTIIPTATGSQKLSDLSLKEVYLKSYDFQTDKEVRGKGAVIPSGRKEVFEIETEDGRKVKATADHKFFVKRGERIVELPLKDLEEGDELICS